jgi:flagellar biosynthetic protein FliR
MTFTSAQLTAWIGAYLWPFCRIGAVLAAVPVIGARSVPVRIRLLFALSLTLVIAPVIPSVPTVDPLSPNGVLVTMQQVLIGGAMGFSLHLIFSAFVHAGQLVAMQMGLGFASLVDPQNGVQVPVLSQFYVVVASLMFLALDGHLVVIEVLVESFRTMPVSATGLAAAGIWDLVSAASRMFAGAVQIALPAVTALLLANIAFGVMARAAPQLNIFSIGFPLTLILGFVALLLTIPSLIPHVSEFLNDGFGLMRHVSGGGN